MSVNKVNKQTGDLVTLANGTRMWIGTKTAHDLAVQQGTMPNNCMVCITDDAAGEEAWEYSTSETNTGKTWIDGKPIYRKSYDLYNFGSANEVVVDSSFNTSNISLINCGGSFRIASSPYHWLQIGYGTSGIRVTQNNVGLQAGSYNTNAVLCWIEYTKTTD